MKPNIHVSESRGELEQAAAAEFLQIVSDVLSRRALCHIALAGGGTPQRVYQLVGSGSQKKKINWERVHLFFGDERMVPPTDAESNYRMVYAELISHVPIPAENVHRMRGEVPAADAAAMYEEELTAIFQAKCNSFDLILLGLGKDGHTASLFPGTDAVEEKRHSVRAVHVPSFGTWRTTLTFPIINKAREVIFLVSGKSKASIVHRLMNSDGPAVDLPASMIRPENGNLRWMLDSDAAELIFSAQ